jgi:hypothetical protein
VLLFLKPGEATPKALVYQLHGCCLPLFGSCGGQCFFETRFIAVDLVALLLLHGCFISGGPLGAVAAANTH